MPIFRARLWGDSVLGLTLFLVMQARAVGEPLYSVSDLGAVSQNDTMVGSVVGRMINIDQSGIVTYSPDGGMASWSGPVPADDRPMWQMARSSDNGQYAVGTAERTVEPFFWDAYVASGASATSIGRVFPPGQDQSSAAYGVNNFGQAVGMAIDEATGSRSAFLYSPGKGTVLISGMGVAYAINNLGQIVGGASSGQPSASHAMLSLNGQTSIDLNSLIPDSSKWTLTTATGINDAGRIVAYGLDMSGTPHALLLTPDGFGPPVARVPEPTTLGYFVLALTMIGIRRASRAMHRGAP
jgi:probable HAF family extracellular repeat protein